MKPIIGDIIIVGSPDDKENYEKLIVVSAEEAMNERQTEDRETYKNCVWARSLSNGYCFHFDKAETLKQILDQGYAHIPNTKAGKILYATKND